MPMDKTRKKSKKKDKNSSLKLLVLFTAVALVTVVILEYIEFRKTGKSFIFTRIIQLERVEEKIEQFNKKLVAVLDVNNISHDSFVDDENKFHFRLDIDEPRFEKLVEKITVLTAKLKGTLELTEIQGFANKSIMLYKVRLGGNVTHFLLITKIKPGIIEEQHPVPHEKREFRPKEKPKLEVKKEKAEYAPRIAFIIDDMGAYDYGALDLIQLNVPITASVLPGSAHVREIVDGLARYGVKTIIHLPMQPTNSNGKHYNPEEVITMNSTDEQVRALIRKAKQIVPFAEGVNNHEGSLVTSDRKMMARILEIIKEENLFFVDSRTIGQSVAYDIAREMNIKTAHKDVFLDHIQGYSQSMEQIRKLVEIAQQNGKAIAIGHPFETTFRAIRDSVRYIESKGVKIVLVKDLLE
jgi:polysaccharide deacetylase 2 family uncharacterized protein YibQ